MNCRFAAQCIEPQSELPRPIRAFVTVCCGELVTRRLREALQLVDIRVLDHMIVADNGCLSFAERGLI
jgi:hypothetical protein